MIKEKTLEREFLGDTADLLRSMDIRTFSQLKERCIGPNKEFIPLESTKLWIGRLLNLNSNIARSFLRKRLIPETEFIKQHPLSCYYTIIKKRARGALRFNNMRTVRDICCRCIEDGEFNSMKGKKIGPRVNYEAALLLRHLGFLSEEAFLRVPLPSWKTRLLTDREVGTDGLKKLHKMKWSEKGKELVINAVSLKFREMDGFKNHWTDITLGQLVKTFVRINSAGELVFYTKGHNGSKWLTTQWFMEKFESAFEEVKEKLQEFDFLPKEVSVV